MSEKVVSENKMGVVPVPKLVLTMSLPIMISMLIQAMYNIVDSIFVAKYSQDAFVAVSLAFPVQNFMIAVAAGTGVGINALLSKSLGEKNYENANKCANNGIFLAGISYLLFLVFGLLFVRVFFESQSKNTAVIEYGVEYLQICSVLSFGLFGQIVFERLLQSTGRTMFTMFSQGAGAIVNIILDPCLIFGLGFFPRMGIAGAAVATVIGQTVAMILALLFNLKFNKDIKIDMLKFRPNGRIIQKIYAVGIPSIIMLSISSFMVFGLNKILKTDIAQGVLGAYFKLQSFIFMPVFGLNNGMVPVLSYNYGAKNKKRMIQTFKVSVLYAMIIMFVGLLLMQLIPETLLRMFDAEGDMIEMGVKALRVISISFIFAGYCIIISSSMQALGHGLLSMFISIIRQLVVLLPSAYILSKIGGVDLVWWSFPIAEIASVICSTIFITHVYKKVIKS